MRQKNILCIVRSSGERTTELCVKRLVEHFSAENVLLLENITPFSKMLQRTIEEAIKHQREWTLVVDADVFFDNNLLDDFIDYAIEANFIDDKNRLFCLLPNTYDHFMQKARSAGVHLYYTKNLSKGLEFINPESLRAETYMIRSVAREGYESYFVDFTISIHDFFQSSEDILTKGVLHSWKHSNLDEIKQLCTKGVQQNPDYEWMLSGMAIGEKYNKIQTNDRAFIRELIEKENITFTQLPQLQNDEIEECLERELKKHNVEKIPPYSQEKKNPWKRIKLFVYNMLQKEKNN